MAEEKEIKLDKYDRAILWQLDINARMSYSDIARKIRLSKQAVRYRIVRLEKEGIIRGYRMLGNLSSMGYIYCRLHVKLFNVDQVAEKSIISSIMKNEKVNWVVSCDGPYDILVGLIGKTEMEIEKNISDIFVAHKNYIFNYDFATVTRLVLFNRGYWLGKEVATVKKYMVGTEKPYIKPQPVPLAPEDKRILMALAGDARVPIVKIAREVGLAPETVSYKIKKFERSGIIAKYFLLLNYRKVGTQLYKALFYANPMEPEVEKGFAEFVASNPYTIDYVKTLAPWQIEVDLEARNNEHYHEIISDIRNKFKGIIKDYETLYILKEHKFLYFPI